MDWSDDISSKVGLEVVMLISNKSLALLIDKIFQSIRDNFVKTQVKFKLS